MGSNAVLVSVDTTSATDNDYITLDDVENIKNHMVDYAIVRKIPRKKIEKETEE